MNLKILLNYCLTEINKINKLRHPKYNKKIKYNDEYYLIMIYYMLNDVNNWKFLSNLKLCKSEYKYHYKTIYNKFRLWTSLKVFENAFKNYNTIYKTNLLLIDATSINNKYGSENVVMNPEYRKKKVTKLSLIVNTNGFIYSVSYFDIKNKNNNYSTAVHDVIMINKNLININKVNNESKYFYLLGDKAYKTQEKLKLDNKIVKIVTPDKKNAKNKNKNTKFLNKKLKKRTKVENVNCFIKKQERIMVRKDRKIKYYMSFVYIACLMNNIICK
jgi:hypothetical protein